MIKIHPYCIYPRTKESGQNVLQIFFETIRQPVALGKKKEGMESGEPYGRPPITYRFAGLTTPSVPNKSLIAAHPATIRPPLGQNRLPLGRICASFDRIVTR